MEVRSLGSNTKPCFDDSWKLHLVAGPATIDLSLIRPRPPILTVSVRMLPDLTLMTRSEIMNYTTTKMCFRPGINSKAGSVSTWTTTTYLKTPQAEDDRRSPGAISKNGACRCRSTTLKLAKGIGGHRRLLAPERPHLDHVGRVSGLPRLPMATNPGGVPLPNNIENPRDPLRQYVAPRIL